MGCVDGGNATEQICLTPFIIFYQLDEKETMYHRASKVYCIHMYLLT